MDIDETNLVLEVANIKNVFEEEQAIPEKDSYRYSKLYEEAKTYASNGAVIDNTVLTTDNILDWFDTQMKKWMMQEFQVKEGYFMLLQQ